MTQGGPANASETINILLFNQAFSYFNMGYAVVDGGGAVRAGDGRVADPDQGAADRGMVRRERRGAVAVRRRLLRAGRLFMLPTVVRLLLDDHAVAEAPGRGHGLSAVVLALQRDLAGYREVFTKYPFFLYTWNSLVVATGCTVLGLAVGLPAAYSIARWRQQRLALAILVARIIPGHRLPDPLVHLLSPSRGWWTPTAALILTHLIVGLPDHHLGDDLVLRGRARRSRGRRR